MLSWILLFACRVAATAASIATSVAAAHLRVQVKPFECVDGIWILGAIVMRYLIDPVH